MGRIFFLVLIKQTLINGVADGLAVALLVAGSIPRRNQYLYSLQVVVPGLAVTGKNLSVGHDSTEKISQYRSLRKCYLQSDVYHSSLLG